MNMNLLMQRIGRQINRAIVGCLALVWLATAATAEEREVPAANGTKPTDPNISGEERAILTFPPFVPLPIKRTHVSKVP